MLVKMYNKIKASLLYRYPIIEVYSVIMNLIIHVKYSFKPKGPLKDKESYIYYLTKNYHIVEKGLSLPNPRAFFGKEKISKLLTYTRKYITTYGEDYHVDNINSALRDYVKFHSRYSNYKSEPLIIEIEEYLKFSASTSTTNDGGIRVIKANVGDNKFSINEYENFIYSRNSVRDFKPDEVLEEDIVKAIKLSMKTPSVCNRQGWGVYAYFDNNQIDNLLKFQNGNAGFGSHSKCLLIIVGKSKAFTRFEYNQLYVDAGMFSMSIINALHALGLGACPLNLCMPYRNEVNLKKVANITADERLIMMVAVGHKKDEYIVAKSPRMNVESVLRIN